jgi:hypothetical protein
MSNINIYSVRDSKAKAFHKPFFLQNDEVMKRELGNLASDPNSLLGKNSEDYDVYLIGEFDERDGTINAIVPEHVISMTMIKEVYNG